MDPITAVGLIASVVSIGGAAMRSAKSLCELVQSIKNAPEELTTISDDTRTFYTIIFDLQTALSERQIEDYVKHDEGMVARVANLKDPLTRCSKLLGQLTVKIQSYLKPTEDGHGLRLGSVERGKWFFTKGEVKELTTDLEKAKATLDLAMSSITMLCTLKLQAAGLKTKASSRFIEQDPKNNEAGSAFREYVREASIAGSFAPSVQNLSIVDVPEKTMEPQSRVKTRPPHSFLISDATERIRKADNQRTALHNAAKSGEEVNIIELVLEDGADVNAKNSDGMTALHFAAMHGKEGAAVLLLQNGANVHARTIPPRQDSWKVERKFLGGRTPLHWAAVEGYDGVVKILLDHHADPGAKNTTYRTPLQEAIMQGHELVARTLIAHDAPINDADDEGWTPLHETCCCGFGGVTAQPRRVAIARLLLDRGAEMEAVTADDNVWGNAMWCHATPLLISALCNTSENLSLLIERGADIHARNRGGEMAIHVAALIGHTAIVSIILDAGFEIDTRDRHWNETALHKAASQDRLPLTKLLLDRGADPRAKNRNGRDVLQHTLAIQKVGDPEIVRLLKKRLDALKKANDE